MMMQGKCWMTDGSDLEQMVGKNYLEGTRRFYGRMGWTHSDYIYGTIYSSLGQVIFMVVLLCTGGSQIKTRI